MTWKRGAAFLPGLGVALLPKLTCPMCWPAYAGLLSTLGLGFLLSERYFFALSATFLSLSVGALAFRASERRGYKPVALGVVAVGLILAAKFWLDSFPLMYSAVGLLFLSSIWNSFPRRAATSCPKCVPSVSGINPLSAQENHHEYEQTNSCSV